MRRRLLRNVLASLQRERAFVMGPGACYEYPTSSRVLTSDVLSRAKVWEKRRIRDLARMRRAPWEEGDCQAYNIRTDRRIAS